MIIDTLNVAELPANREEAFIKFVTDINKNFAQNIENDRQRYSDQNGEYEGSYEPERSYVTNILAFLDEYRIESEIMDISELSDQDFPKNFRTFKSKVEYLVMRYKLRQNRIESGGIGTLITISSDYKAEIGKLLDTARKIVNQEVPDTNKKNKIFAKIANLQSEVDRDQTTVDAVFGRMLDLTEVIGKSADNLEPLLDKLEQAKKLLWDNSKKVEELAKPDRPKLITKEDTLEHSDDMDNDITF